MTITLINYRGGIGIVSPKNYQFLDDLKRAVPSKFRAWRRPLWVVHWAFAPQLIECIESNFGERPDLPVQWKYPNEQIKFCVKYVGKTKQQLDDPEFWGPGANARADDYWQLVFYEDALEHFFLSRRQESKESKKQNNDYYDLLLLHKNADENEIKKAYRRLARQWHPDINKEPEATDMFIKVQDAYQTLSDPMKRKRYDFILGALPPPTFDFTQDLRQTVGYRDRYGYRAPLTCGWVTCVGQWRGAAKFYATEIKDWQDIIDEQGRTLVTYFNTTSGQLVEQWVI